MTKFAQAGTWSSVIGVTDAATTELTANLDTQGADYATFVLHLSAEANTNATGVTYTISQSDDTTATNFATYDSNISSITVDNTAAVSVPIHINMDGSRKRYQRITVTPDTTTNGAVGICVGAVLMPERRSASLGTNEKAV